MSTANYIRSDIQQMKAYAVADVPAGFIKLDAMESPYDYPEDMKKELGRALAAVPGVKEIHDLHVWPLGAERMALSAHVRVADLAAWPRILAALTRIAAHEGVAHVTFQAEPPGGREQVVRFARR